MYINYLYHHMPVVNATEMFDCGDPLLEVPKATARWHACHGRVERY